MKYLLLLYEDESLLAQPGVAAKLRRTDAKHIGEEFLQTSGRWLAGDRLRAADAVATVSIQQDRLHVEAGAAVEKGSHLSAFYLIEAHDLNDAIQVAAQLPQARLGSIEVRPLAE